ncbi:1,4-dihydroxy-2-naphthoyl-CoA hydrolase [Calycomorphotria hydatis]|uniref:1,4-dihydroxy-2-naphthoyl-CoA hydrolase n=2 Tax=Calycomorphotria hydatis TaxID=2528027 RepID=A0A517T9L4_9PLAN|nr:1,4-dihydroxy-2-naphthoyl-CoA hydrolase [Calycomorphotria hydatis]
MAGIVHFASFYEFMEDAEHEFFRSVDLSIMEKQDDGTIIGWPRVSSKCNFKAPAYFEDVLQVKVTVERIGVKSLTLNYDFHRDGEWIASGVMKTVCCRFQPGQPMESIAIPENYLAVIQEAPRA